MELILTVLVAALACVGVFAVLGCAAAWLFRPLRRRQVRLWAVVCAAGDAQGLENTVRGLKWMAGSRPGGFGIIIADSGLTPQARKTAELLSRDDGDVTVCSLQELREMTWETPDLTTK